MVARGESVDGRSDLFSLGSVLYAMCTGHPPFRANSSYGVMRRITDEEPRPIRDFIPEIPEWLSGFVAMLMAKRPQDRFESASEVLERLFVRPVEEKYLEDQQLDPEKELQGRIPDEANRLAALMIVRQRVLHQHLYEKHVLHKVCDTKGLLLTDDQCRPLKRVLHQRYSSASPEASSCKRCRSRIFANG